MVSRDQSAPDKAVFPNRRVYTAAVAAATVVAIIYGVSKFYEQPQRAAQEQVVSGKLKPPSHVDKEAPVEAVQTSRPASFPIAPTAKNSSVISEAIRRQFEEASNYAAFIEDALNRPSEGGRFYAVLAFNRCADVSSVNLATARGVGEWTAARESAAQAVERLQARCSGVNDKYPDFVTFSRIVRDTRSQADALLIDRGLITAAREEFADADLARAKSSGDRYLLGVTLEVNAEHLVKLHGGPAISSLDSAIIYAASAAAACEVSMTCDNGFVHNTSCVSGGVCTFPDQRDRLRNQVPPEAQANFELARRFFLSIARTTAGK